MIYTGSNQRIPEYHAWTSLCIGVGVKNYVELGCGSSHAQRDAGMQVVTVDILPNGMPGIPHIQGDSHDPAIVPRVLELLGGEPDCVFVDADHEETAVAKDFLLWWPIAKKLVGFHDILMPSVAVFWNNISRHYPSIQLVSRDILSANKWQHGCPSHTGDVNCGGIGVLFKELQ